MMCFERIHFRFWNAPNHWVERDAEDARLAVKNVAAAINPGGTIYIIGQILDDSRISPPEAVGFNLSLISQFDSGESYTEQEHRAWLSDAGFAEI